MKKLYQLFVLQFPKMKQLCLLGLFAILSVTVVGQTEGQAEGTVSYVTSGTVYVRFASTDGMAPGDTLFIKKGTELTPAVLITHLSSMSAAGTPLNNIQLKVSDALQTGKNNAGKQGAQPANEQPVVGQPEQKPDDVVQVDTDSKSGKDRISRLQSIKGRVSAAAYANMSNSPADNLLRMKYNLSVNAKNISDSPLSAETYISMVSRYRKSDGTEQNNPGDTRGTSNDIRIYNLAVSYDITDNFKAVAGRKINPKLSNMGAVDGLQLELRKGTFTTGLLAGSRPHNVDYGLNTSLFQYGMFISHDKMINKGNSQSTVAFVDQKNAGNTDRRFIYFQHSNSIFNNLYFYGSAEFALYSYVNEMQDNAPKMSNLYFSLRYKALKNLSLSLSYSARKNIIYYVTYKSFLDKLLNDELQQGYMAQVNYRPLKKLTVGATAGYRDRKDSRPSKNVYIYTTYSDLPVINAALTLSATLLESVYLNGNVYSINLSRSILKNKVTGNIGYKYQQYKFVPTAPVVKQNTAEAGLNWYILKKLSFGMYYEGNFEKAYTFHRVHFQLAQRF